MSKKLLDRHRWRATQGQSRRHVRHDTALRRDLDAITNIEVTGQADLPAHGHEITYRRAARNAGHGGDHTTTPQFHVVPDLHQIINPASGTDHGIAHGASVNGRIGADIAIIADQDTPYLGYFYMPARVYRKAETILADPPARVQCHPVANLTMGTLAGTGIPLLLRRMGLDPALASNIFLTLITDIIGFGGFLVVASILLR